MNIIEAFDDTFSAWLGDPAQWKAWRPFLKSLGGIPLDKDEYELFKKCTGRSRQFAENLPDVDSGESTIQVPATAENPTPGPGAPSEAWVVVGRRGRKSAIAAILGVYAAAFKDWSGCIAPGETARVLIVATSKDQATLIKRYAEAILRSTPELEILIKGKVEKEKITLINGIEIVCCANSYRSIRGPAVCAAIFEELAFWRSEESTTPDREVLRAVKPSMLTTKKHGAFVIGISSAYAKKGLLYEKYKQHFGDDESKVLVWQADTLTMNPEADADEIEEAYKDDPVSAESEYGSVFRGDLSNFLDPDLLTSVTRTSPLELPYAQGIEYFGFTDPSGGRDDAFTLAIAHKDEDGKAIIDLVREKIPPFDPAEVTADFAEVLKTYRLKEVTGDAYAGEWPRKAYENNSISYNVSKMNKSKIYLESLPLFTQGKAELPDIRKLLVQLGQLERKTARAGKDTVDHPARCKDDSANSVCGALSLAANNEEMDAADAPPPVDTEPSKHNVDNFEGGVGSGLGGSFDRDFDSGYGF